MLYKPGNAYTGQFTTSNPYSGAAVNADSLPVATATQNGMDDGAFTLTVTNVDIGRYKVTGTIPGGYVAGDRVQISVAATVAGVAGKGVVDSFRLVAFDPTNATSLGLTNLDVAVSTRSTYAGADTSGTTTLLSRLTSSRATNLDNLDTAVSTRSIYAGADTSGTTTLLARLTGNRATNLDNLDVAVSSRLASSGYTAPDNSTIVSAANSAALASAASAATRKLLEADRVIDTTVTPWALVLIEKGTGGLGVGTELLRQELHDVTGANVVATTTIVGQSLAS